jgi:DNA replication protein DnaC
MQIEDATDRLLASLEAHETRTKERLAAIPGTKPCPTCGETAELDPKSLWSDRSGKRDVIIVPTEPRYHCPTCLREKAEQQQRDRYLAKGIPRDVLHATLDNFVIAANPKNDTGYTSPAKFLSNAKAFESGELRNLILAGTAGLGKGHLAAAVAKLRIDAGKRVRWTTCARLFADYHLAYKSDATQDVIAPLVRADLLVLDEVCFRDLPSDGEEILFEVIDPRSQQGKQTLILGNKPAHETREWLGERILDRLRSGKLAFCYGSWTSMRGTENDGANDF